MTSHRELTILESGGLLIDNPGMREIGIIDSADGLETMFDNILSLSRKCRCKDCTHTNEVDCAVIEAIEQGQIDRNAYENLLKIERIKEHFDLSVTEKGKRINPSGKW